MIRARIRNHGYFSVTFILLTCRLLSCTSFLFRNNERTVGRIGNTLKSTAPKVSTPSSTITTREILLARNSSLSNSQNPIPPFTPNATLPLRNGDPWKTTFGILLGAAIITGLAGTTEPNADPIEGAYDTVFNVIDATVPTSSTDLVAVALGEAIAGVIGAFLTAILRSVASKDRKPLVTEALVDSDFFIAQAGLRPTLEAVGVPPVLATLGSVVVASVPSQLVKLTSQQKQRLSEQESSLLDSIDLESVDEEKGFLPQLSDVVATLRQIRSTKKNDDHVTQEVERATEFDLDFVEIFSDVTRWLGYDVLTSDFGDLVYGGNPYSPGVMGITFGYLAGFTARLYADLMYGVLRYGPEVRQAEVRTRQLPDWFGFYASCSLSSATLFGVYEQSKGPVSRWIQGILAGGFDACLGSDSFETCFDTYIHANAPGPSPEAEFRALITNLVMVNQRLQDIAGDTTSDDIERLVRAWAVSAYSYMNHLILG